MDTTREIVIKTMAWTNSLLGGCLLIVINTTRERERESKGSSTPFQVAAILTMVGLWHVEGRCGWVEDAKGNAD